MKFKKMKEMELKPHLYEKLNNRLQDHFNRAGIEEPVAIEYHVISRFKQRMNGTHKWAEEIAEAIRDGIKFLKSPAVSVFGYKRAVIVRGDIKVVVGLDKKRKGGFVLVTVILDRESIRDLPDGIRGQY